MEIQFILFLLFAMLIGIFVLGIGITLIRQDIDELKELIRK